MYQKASINYLFTMCCLVLVSLVINGGCHFRTNYFFEKPAPSYRINKVVVVGFQSAMSQGEEPGVVRDPLSGAVFMAEPVSHEVVQRMTDILFDRLVAESRYELVSPGQAKGVFSSIVYSDLNVGMGPIKVLKEVGKAFQADAVLAGFIYRWREREGNDYGVNRAASVAFDIHLIRPADGTVLWKGKFDKTQQSLSENLFDVATFVKGRGRWMTVEKLATVGLQKLLSEISPGPKESGSSEIDNHSSY
jgi:hypothetical protein